MEPVFGYYTAGLASVIIVSWNRRRLKLLISHVLRYSWDTWKYLLYKQVVKQHRHLGPWTAAGIFLHIIYFSANGAGVLYHPLSGSALVTRSGVAALANISYLACSPNVDLLSQIFGVTTKTWERLHRTAAWMVGVLVTLHLMSALSQQSVGQLTPASRVGSILGSTIVLAMLSASFITRFAQEGPDSFLASMGALASKFHLPLAIAALVATYIHVITEVGISWQIVVVPICFAVILVRDFGYFLYRNGMLSGQAWTRVSMTILANETIRINVYPGRPVRVFPGQYVMLWVPSMTPWWHFKLEQYHVQSWAFRAQPQLKLFRSVKPTPRFLDGWGLFNETPRRRAFFTGPYGVRHDFLQYETILVVVHDYGLLSLYAQIQEIYQCIEDRTSKTRRIHLVWQWDPLRGLPADCYPREIRDQRRAIDAKLDQFSREVSLERAAIEYHLGMYNPSEELHFEGDDSSTRETEADRLKRLIKKRILDQETDSDTVKGQKYGLRLKIDGVAREIEGRDRKVNEFISQFYDDVRIWMNGKLKRNIDNFSQEYTVYDTGQKTDSKSGRAQLRAGLAPLRSLFEQEIANHRERTLKSPTETRGMFLLMISSPPSVQGLAHELAIENLRDVDLREFQYQPGHRF